MQEKIKDIKTTNRTRVISWEAPEDVYILKTKSWYAGAIVLGLILMTAFFFLRQYLSMAVVFAAALALYSQGREKPEIIRYTLNEEGVNFKNTSIPYNKLKSFWVTEGQIFHKLYLEKLGTFSVPLIIYISKMDPKEIQEFLKQYLPGKEVKKGNFQDNISRLLRF